MKEVGGNQAGRAKTGNLNQAQKPRESTRNTLRSSDRNAGAKVGKPKHSNSGDSQARDLLFADDRNNHPKSSSSTYTGSRGRYEDNILQSDDLESRSVQELESYGVHKSAETTSRLQNSLKVAESIKGDATRTMITLHQQGEQIRRTHDVAVDIDQHLSRGEKLLGSLGGIFSRTWKPKKSRAITGPRDMRNGSFKRKGSHMEQRAALGLDKSNPKSRKPQSSSNSSAPPQQQTFQEKIEAERQKQDDALSDLSNVLDELKVMSIDMSSEISSQTKALDYLEEDVVELQERVKGANERGRRLLGR